MMIRNYNVDTKAFCIFDFVYCSYTRINGNYQCNSLGMKLSDSFFVPGAVFVGIALIGWISSKGTFDIFGYSIRGLFYLFKSESYYKQTSFYDYRVKKQESRKSFNRNLRLSGVIFLLLGAIATTAFLLME